MKPFDVLMPTGETAHDVRLDQACRARPKASPRTRALGLQEIDDALVFDDFVSGVDRASYFSSDRSTMSIGHDARAESASLYQDPQWRPGCPSAGARRRSGSSPTGGRCFRFAA
jgi:hypothetical protein